MTSTDSNASDLTTDATQRPAKSWHDEIRRYENQYKAPFVTRGEKVVERYRDERRDSDNVDTRFNIFWSNVKTLKPAIYFKPPSPDVTRRFKDNDPIARAACQILERSLDYELQQFADYDVALSNAVDDRLIVGRGNVWVRYEPLTEPNHEFLEDDIEPGDAGNDVVTNAQDGDMLTDPDETMEVLKSETSPVDYVHWKDFAHDPARTWGEVTWVARRVYLTRAEGVERFGDTFKAVPLVNVPNNNAHGTEVKQDNVLKKAEVWEIWNKPTKQLIWIAKDWQEILDEKDDPLGLPDFYPCPRPLYSTITTDSLIPVSDYAMYQDQAKELDEVSGRIRRITKGLKQAGFYAADIKEIERLAKEGQDTVLIPVENWQALSDKGGIAGAIAWMPLAEAVQVLAQLYQSRKEIIQVIYEITGLPDIIRGASDPNETLGAQQLKTNNAGTRLNAMKREIAKFAVEVIRMKAHIMCTLYQPQTLIEASGIMHTDDAQYAEQAIQLLRDNVQRDFVIDIEDDALIEADEQQDKQNRIEFLDTVGKFLESALQVVAHSPELLPLMGEMIMFAVRGFKVGESMESCIETAIKALQQKAAQAAQNPQPNPEMMKIQGQLQVEQAKAAADKQAAETDAMVKLMEMKMQEASAKAKEDLERMIAEREIAVKELGIQSQERQQAMNIEFERWRTELQEATKLEIARMSLEMRTAQAEAAAEKEVTQDMED